MRSGEKRSGLRHFLDRGQAGAIKNFAAIGQIVAYALNQANGFERNRSGAASADRNRGIGVRPDDEDGHCRFFLQRQHVVFVLQQDRAFARGLEGHGIALAVVA